VSLIDGIDHGEAVDQAPSASKHHFLVENAPISLARQHKPGLAEAAVAQLVIAVRMARDIGSVCRRGVPRLVDKPTHEQARIPSGGYEDLLIAQQAAAALAEARDSGSDPITEAVEAAATEMAVESLLGGDSYDE